MATAYPLGSILRNRHCTGRIAKCAAELAEFEIDFVPRTAIKSQALADIIAEWTLGRSPLDESSAPSEVPSQCSAPVFMGAPWELYFDGSSRQHQVGIGVVLVSPTWEKLRYIVYLLFQATNNAAEYEGLVAELTLALSFGVKEIRVMGDSQLVINQVNGECACNHP